MRPLAVRVARNDRTVAFGVLVSTRRRGVRHIRTPTENGEPYALLYDEPDDLDALCRGLAAHLASISGPWTLLVSGLPSDGLAGAHLAAALSCSHVGTGRPSPRVDVGPAQTATTVSTRNTRSAVAKARNRIRADGHELSVRWLRDPADVERYLDDIVAIRAHRNRDLARGFGADSAEEATFRACVVGHAGAGRADVLVTLIDGVTAAYAMCFRGGTESWVYSNSVSPDFLRYSAGAVANAEVVLAGLADPAVTVVNWGAGVQRYKLSGPVTLDHPTTVTAWSSPAVRGAEAVAARMLRWPRAGVRRIRGAD